MTEKIVSYYESQGSLTTTTSAYRTGCEGFVRSAILKLEGREPLLVKTKGFYRNSYDDRGDPFTQNPNEEVERSYAAYKNLDAKGFKVLPDYGVVTDSEGKKTIVMTDLSEGGTKEVYDEGSIHQAKKVKQTVNGQTVYLDALEVRRDLDNTDEISLGFLHSYLLSCTHDIILGNGTAHMLVRNPETNLGKLYVVDLGEAYNRKSKYRDALSEKQLEKLFEIPEDEVISIFQDLLEAHYPHLVEHAKEIFDEYTANNVVRREFQELFYKAAVGMALMEWLGGWAGAGKWARKKFVRNDFSEHLLTAKSSLEKITERYQKYTKETLFKVMSQDVKQFLEAKNVADLHIGVDIAFLTVVDKRIQEIIAFRQMVDDGQEPTERGEIMKFGNDSLPRYVFFENFDDERSEKVVMELQCQDLRDTLNGVLLVEFGWEDGYEITAAGGAYGPHGGSHTPFFKSEAIKSLEVEGKIVEDFDPRKVEIHIQRRIRGREDPPKEAPLEKGDCVYYMYDDQIIYYLII